MALKEIDQERLDIAETAVLRLLNGIKGRGKPLKGLALEQMKLIEEAAQKLEAARLIG